MYDNPFSAFLRKNSLKYNALALSLAFGVILLFLTILSFLSDQKGKNLYLTMSLRTAAPGEASLYYDLGGGFREEDKAVTQIRTDPSAVAYTFAIPNKNLFRFRFDPPATFEETLSVGDIQIVNARGKTLRQIPVNGLKPLHQIQTFQQTGAEVILTIQPGADDPQVGIDLDSPFLPAWNTLKDGSLLGLIAGEILLLLLAYFWILHLWPRWRTHSKRKEILVALLFLYAGGLWIISEKATTTYLKVTMQSASSGIAQLFFDTGSGYSEESSVRVNVTGGTNFSDYYFHLPSRNILQFRFDPLSSAGRLVIRRMEVVSGLGILIRSLALYQVQPVHQIREYKLLDQDLRIVTEEEADDPQLMINLQQPLHISKIDLLQSLVFFVCILLLLPILLLSITAIAWVWQESIPGIAWVSRKVNVEWFFYPSSNTHKYIIFAVFGVIGLIILSAIHRQSYSDALRYTRVAEGNISQAVHQIWTRGMSGLADTIHGDAQTWGRIRPAHWLFYNIPYALTLARNGDLIRQDAMVPVTNRINGDLQTHTLFLILCMAIACGGLAWLVWYLSRSWLAFLLFPLYVGFSYTLCENLLVNYADSQEIPQLLWISLYLVSIGRIFSGQKPSAVCEMCAALFLLLAYATKETSLVMLPVCSSIFGLLFLYAPKDQRGFRLFCLRQIGWQVIFSVILVAFVWSFRSGAYAGANYLPEWQTLSSSFWYSIRIFDLGVSWINLLLLASIPLCLLLIRGIVRKQLIVGRQNGLLLLLIIAVGLCYGFWMINMPWKAQLAKYYLPAVFWGSLTVVILQIYLAEQLLKSGYHVFFTIWLIGSCWYMLGDLPNLNARIQHFYMNEYGYRESVPIISKDIVSSVNKQPWEVYRVHVVGSALFQEGALPFQRQVNLLYGMNIALKGHQVQHVTANELNYFRSYPGQPAAEITLSQALPDRSEKDVIYVCQLHGEKELSGVNLESLRVTHRWDDALQGIRIVKYEPI